MRVALERNPTRRRVSTAQTIPAPVKGLDAISPLAEMDPEYATVLDNLFCQPGYLELRRDRILHANLGLPTTPVESVMAYNGAGSEKLFAAAGGQIVDVTTGGATPDLSGLSNDRWQHINFATSGGNFLWVCNGEDTPRTYNGSAWASVSISGSVTSTDIVQVAAHKNRLWFVEKGTSDAHYLGVDSIQGTTSAFPLGGLFTKGGYLQAIATWSRDGGAGPDDLICFASSRGQVAVYAGVDPSGSDFVVVGVFDTAPPIGRRCFTKVGADLALITIDGVLPLSRALVTERSANLRISMTQRIQPILSALGRTNAEMFGWQLTPYPRGTAAFLNVPITENQTSVQYVMNTVTGAWSRYTGWNANTFEVFQDRLFFGGNDGCVYEADRGGLSGNSVIDVDMRTAYNYFGRRGQAKHFKMLRGLLTTDGRINPRFALNTNFRDDAPLLPIGGPSLSLDQQAHWDQALWDQATWPVDQLVKTNWFVTRGIGHCASLRMGFQVQRSESASSLWDVMLWDQGFWNTTEFPAITFQINAMDVIFENGGLM